MTNKQLIKKLEQACVVCRDCGNKYGVYSVGCSSTWEGKCGVCDQVKPVTETRDYGYLMTGIRKLLKEDIKEQSKNVAEYMFTQTQESEHDTRLEAAKHMLTKEPLMTDEDLDRVMNSSYKRGPMTNQHPITPPQELVQQWASEFYGATIAPGEASIDIAIQAAQWGADQELEACCEWFQEFYKTESWVKHDLKHFRAARRPAPKPPETIEVDGFTYRLVQ